MTETTCAAPDCTEGRWGRKSYCRRHQGRMDRNGTLEPQKRGPKSDGSEGLCRMGDGRPARHRNLCNTHYKRLQRGTPLDAPIRQGGGACSIDGCDEPRRSKGMCASHYSRQRRHGDAEAERAWVLRDPICSVEGCELEQKAKGYCSAHYQRARRDGDVGSPEIQEKVTLPESCSFPGCTGRPRARGLCSAHYRQQRDGVELREKGNYAPAGAGHVNRNGYRVFKIDGVSRFEHHLVAEKVLGRALYPHENVHHVNGDRLDQSTDGPFVVDERGRMRSGNLEVWSTFQPPGQEVGPKVDWALTLLEEYRDVLRPEHRERLAAALA